MSRTKEVRIHQRKTRFSPPAEKSFPFICADTEDNAKELQKAGKSGFLKQVTQIAAIAANGERFYNTGNVQQFLEWFQRRPEKYMYFHNLQYDLGNLFGKKHLDAFDATMVGGRIIRAVWGNKEFRDSFNIWPMALKKVAPAFGMEKIETEDMAHDKEYVFNDTEIVRQAMLFAWQMAAAMGLKYLPATLGGLCIKAWKHWGGENVHDSVDLSKEAYYGGRVELFKPCNDGLWQLNGLERVYAVIRREADINILQPYQTEDVAYTDINSLYPSVMLGDFPGYMEDFGTQLPDYGVATVSIKMPETDIAVLPFRDDNGRITFPWGKFTGTWTMPEIREAVAAGGEILKVHKAYGTNEVLRPYGTFVTRLYEARLASKSDAEKLFFKLLMNNLYGRLGTGGEIGRTVWQNERNKFDGVPYGDKVLVQYQMPLSEETNWSHAAYVTSYGRLALLKFLRQIGAEKLIYCDTDSTIFDCPSRQLPFSVGTDLGQMKLESWEKEAVAFLPKLYKAGKKYKAKGVPVKYAKQFFETGRAEFQLPFKIREAMRFYDRKNIRQLSVWRPVAKKRNENYDRKTLKQNRYFPCKVNALCVS